MCKLLTIYYYHIMLKVPYTSSIACPLRKLNIQSSITIRLLISAMSQIELRETYLHEIRFKFNLSLPTDAS